MAKKLILEKKIGWELVLLTLGIILVVAIISFKFNVNTDSNTPSEPAQKLFESSSTMNFSVILPNNFVAEDKLDLVLLKSKEGEIAIAFNSTNYDDLMSHLSSPLNNILEKLDSNEALSINNYDVILGFINEKKTYYIYAGSAVYFLSTSSPELYDELDAIAQSFRYLGE